MNDGRRGGGGAPKPSVSDTELKRIIQGADYSSTAALVKTAEEWGGYLKDQELKTSQIRTIFASVRQIEMSWPAKLAVADDSSNEAASNAKDAQSAATQLVLLKPKLAYQAGRNEEVKPLADLLARSIDFVGEDREHFQRFMNFFEAILAYHKAKGGKD